MKPKIELCPFCAIPIIAPRVARSRFYEDTRICPDCGSHEAIYGRRIPFSADVQAERIESLEQVLEDRDDEVDRLRMQVDRLVLDEKRATDKYRRLARRHSTMKVNMEALLREVTNIEHDFIRVAEGALSGEDFETIKEALEGTYTIWWDTDYTTGLKELPTRKESYDVSTTGVGELHRTEEAEGTTEASCTRS